MGVLDDAAEELVKKILPFSGLLDDVKERLDELDGDLDGLQKQLDTEWDELEEKASAFIARVNDEREKVEQKADKAGEALSELKGAVETAQGQLEGEMDGAQAELKALSDAVGPLDDDMETLVAGHLEKPGDDVASRAEALVREIELTVKDTQASLESAVTKALQTTALTVDMWAESVLKAASESEARLDRAYQDFAVRLAEGGDLVRSDIFQAVTENLDATVVHAAEECDKAHDAKLDDMQQVIDAIKQQLGELENTVEGAGEKMEAAGEALESALGELKGEILGAQKELDKMEKWLARYTFTQ
jgi:predicted  nucleic acid-binding Zn-ribbon protein